MRSIQNRLENPWQIVGRSGARLATKRGESVQKPRFCGRVRRGFWRTGGKDGKDGFEHRIDNLMHRLQIKSLEAEKTDVRRGNCHASADRRVAQKSHKDQPRPGGKPYDEHLLDVVDEVVEHYGIVDTLTVAVAMLHHVTEISSQDVYPLFSRSSKRSLCSKNASFFPTAPIWDTGIVTASRPNPVPNFIMGLRTRNLFMKAERFREKLGFSTRKEYEGYLRAIGCVKLADIMADWRSLQHFLDNQTLIVQEHQSRYWTHLIDIYFCHSGICGKQLVPSDYRDVEIFLWGDLRNGFCPSRVWEAVLTRKPSPRQKSPVHASGSAQRY